MGRRRGRGCCGGIFQVKAGARSGEKPSLELALCHPALGQPFPQPVCQGPSSTTGARQ